MIRQYQPDRGGQYPQVFATQEFDPVIYLHDHLLGFDSDLHSTVLDHVQSCTHAPMTVQWQNYATPELQSRYPLLKFGYHTGYLEQNWNHWFAPYLDRVPSDLQGFMCSFNRQPHVSRQLLVTHLWRRGLWDARFISKHFKVDAQRIDHEVTHVMGGSDRLYLKLFADAGDGDFLDLINGFRPLAAMNHRSNAQYLLPKVTGTWVHLVSETLATSYYPFVTEKFLYSVASRGLFLAWAQPGWHQHLRDYFGFQLYDRIFDYGFDAIVNPVVRLTHLVDGLQRLHRLSVADLDDLREWEKDRRDFNHHHFASGAWLRHLKSRFQHQLV